MTRVPIPESIRFYFENSGNAEAIDALAGQVHKRSKVSPDDMGLNDLATYHKALLAAYRTKVDYWLFHKSVWDATWGVVIEAINKSGSGKSRVEPCAPHEYEGELSLDYVWDDAFYCMHRLEQKQLVTGVWAEAAGVSLLFYVEDGIYELSNGLSLGNALWEPESYPAEDMRYTSAFGELTSDQPLNCEDLQEAASHAMTVLQTAL